MFYDMRLRFDMYFFIPIHAWLTTGILHFYLNNNKTRVCLLYNFRDMFSSKGYLSTILLRKVLLNNKLWVKIFSYSTNWEIFIFIFFTNYNFLATSNWYIYNADNHCFQYSFFLSTLVHFILFNCDELSAYPPPWKDM